jgi:phosphatidate cytidylyltransferase
MNENVVRSLSGLVYIFLIIFATLFSKESFLLVFGLFLLQTVSEFCNLVKLPKMLGLLIALSLYLLFAVFLNSNNYLDSVLLVVSLGVAINLIFWLFNQKSIAFALHYKWVNLIGYVILPFIFFTKIPINNNQFLPSIIISIFILIWTNDTFAYIVGKSIGKSKLFESISPKKTIEGFAGGLVFAIIASVFVAKYYVNMPIYIWVFSAVILSVFGTLGDLVESKFKRIASVKDSGNIMPGHGGLLDRLDSIIFVSPFLFLFYKLIVYVS